ncbi:MAG: 1-acyl-sn-glycerol-3-phosphate acyltransferase [Deltaproteobacteria bacterium]|jgi:1-acyl-sn-glycerol-3-phosphate acyltransferase|nr:1-acyl-sn-glycerol-3-phosphate acyltransferase [Deltaproteobacteria bacterium]
MKFSSLPIYVATVLRALIGIVLLPPWTVFVSVTVILLGALGRIDQVTYWMATWSKAVLWFYGVDVIHDGLEKIPAQGGAILLFNHQSHFDVPAVTAYSGRRLRYGAKIELFRIPFFGPAIRASGCLPIARDNRTEVLRIYDEAAARFKEGVVFALAPEGTRQAKPVLGNFKKGPFIFAVKSKVPVVPVVIEGADRVLPKGDLLVNIGQWRRTIRVRGLDPLYPAVVGESEPLVNSAVTDLLERSRTEFEKSYLELQRLAQAAKRGASSGEPI